MPVINGKGLIENRVNAIKQYHQDSGIKKAELDLSGGIDSAVMACLLHLALGKENVLLVHTQINTNPEQTRRATELAEALGSNFVCHDFTDIFSKIQDNIILSFKDQYLAKEVCERMDHDPTILGSMRSTIRGFLGRAYNRSFGGGIRHGTGNECEDRFLRYYQKGGDGEVDTNPIEMLSKTEVFQLAYHLSIYPKLIEDHPAITKVLRETIDALPSADLWGTGDNHNDEDELLKNTGVKLTYGRIDSSTGKIIKYGTIEMISRMLDVRVNPVYLSSPSFGFGELLFDTRNNNEDEIKKILKCFYDKIKLSQYKNIIFECFYFDEIVALLMAVKKAEFQTRHKANNNIPMLGSRQELVDLGIISNNLIKMEN